MIDTLPFDFDVNNSDHIDWLETHCEELSETVLSSIYNIVDLDIQKESHQTYMTYNVRDVDLIDRLEAKMKLIEIALVFAYDAGCNYADVFGTVRPWDAIIHRYLMDRKVVVPFQKLTDKEYKIEGGFVKDPLLGKHHWVASIDLKSSYPHQIMQYNMGPETKVDKVEGINAAGIVSGSCDPYRHVYDHVCVSGNGARFRTDVVSFLSTLMSENFNKRKRYKALMEEHEKLAEQATEPAEKKKHLDIASSYDNKQHSLKIKINALYGSLANKYCRWYDPDIAESITQSGQLAIRWAQKTVNELLNKICKTTNHDYIIAIDTDSLYISLERLIDMKYKDQTNVDEIVTFIDTFMKSVILPTIESSYQKMVETTNAHSQRMSMNREVIASAGIWTGKKHYILKMCDKEGFRYDPPKFKLVGIEAVRSSTAGAARERIKKAIEVIMNEDEVALQRYVSECRREFMTLPIPDIATPKSANEVDKWKDSANLTAKGTPLQVKALIYHNELLKRLEITKYPELKAGDKIKYVYLKDPNPYGITCIGFMNILPPEFGLDEFVDRTVQFNKGLLEPLNTITNVIGWSPKPRATLDAFLS